MVDSPVAVEHFIGRDSAGKSKNLVAEANSEKWNVVVEYLLYCFYHTRHGRRVARAVGNHVPVRLPLFHFCVRSCHRINMHAASALNQRADYIFLGSDIEHGYTMLRIFISYSVCLLSRNLRRQFQPSHGWYPGKNFPEL